MSTVIVITPPPKSPYLNEAQYKAQMEERQARLERDMQSLREAGFNIDIKYPGDTEAEDEEDSDDN